MKTIGFSKSDDVMFSMARREKLQVDNEDMRHNKGMLKTLLQTVLCFTKQELLLW